MEDGRYHNKSVMKAFQILKSFSQEDTELSLGDISRRAQLPKATAHRLVTTLVVVGVLQQNHETGKYGIGPQLYTIGSLYLNSTDLIKSTSSVMKTLKDITGETVVLGILDKGSVTGIMKEEPRNAFRFTMPVGSTVPAYGSAIGKALLSELTDAEIDYLYPEEKLLPVTGKSLATRTALKKELAEIRKSKVAFDAEGGYEGVEGIGCVIRDATGKAIAGMSIPVPIFRIDEGRRKKMATLVRLGCSLVSYRLGYQDISNPVRDIKELVSWWELNR
jgi:IclR family KDG regulon transcriptional repressor